MTRVQLTFKFIIKTECGFWIRYFLDFDYMTTGI